MSILEAGAFGKLMQARQFSRCAIESLNECARDVPLGSAYLTNLYRAQVLLSEAAEAMTNLMKMEVKP